MTHLFNLPPTPLREGQWLLRNHTMRFKNERLLDIFLTFNELLACLPQPEMIGKLAISAENRTWALVVRFSKILTVRQYEPSTGSYVSGTANHSNSVIPALRHAQDRLTSGQVGIQFRKTVPCVARAKPF